MNFHRRLWISVYILFIVALPIMADQRFKAACKDTKFCQELSSPDYYCNMQKEQCLHRPLFPYTKDLPTKDVIGFILVILISAIANASGLGGGAVLAPVYNFVFGYTIQEAIPLTKATILAGAIVNVALIFRNRHPNKPKEYLIDYGLSSILIPLLLAGTVIGVMLTKALPPIIIIIGLTVFLIKSGLQTYAK